MLGCALGLLLVAMVGVWLGQKLGPLLGVSGRTVDGLALGQALIAVP